MQKREKIKLKRIQKLENRFTILFVEDKFLDKAEQKKITAEMPDFDKYLKAKETVLRKSKRKMMPCFKACYQEPLLNLKQEHHLFRQYNFLKWQARNAFLKYKYTLAENILNSADEIRSLLVQSNTRLVVSVAKLYKQHSLDDMISDGYFSLSQIIDHFDYARGIKFSTYAMYAIKNNFNRNISRQKFAFSYDGNFDALVGVDLTPQKEILQNRYEQLMETLVPLNSDRDSLVLVHRFGLYGREPQTLKDIGKTMGVSKERIRQLEVRAMTRLREIVVEKNITWDSLHDLVA